MTDRRIAQSANNTRPAKLPALNVPRELENQLRTLLEAMKERLEVREGARGNPYERALTVRDLEQFKAQAAPATPEATTQTTAPGITETRVKQLVGDALSVEINTLRAAIATVERALPTLTSGSQPGGGDGANSKESMAYGASSRYTQAQLSADLASGGATILSGALAGTTIMELDAGGAYVLFKHRLANINGLGAGYAGVVRTATGITANGFVAGYNRLSDGAWQSSIVVESSTGNVTILGTLRAGSVIEVGATVGAGGTAIGTVATNASTALTNAAAAQSTADTALASAATKLSAGSSYVLAGAVTVQDTGGLRAGTVTWNATTGVVTGGSGVVLTENGLTGVKSGVPTFSITAAGDATFAGDIRTGGKAEFAGRNADSGLLIGVGGTNYAFEHSSLSIGASNPVLGGGAVRVGSVGYASAAVSFRNVGVFGKGFGVGKGIGVVGDGTIIGGFFASEGSGTGLVGFHPTGGVGVECLGTFKFGSYTYAQPNGSATEFLCRDGTWKESLRIMPTNSGTAASSGGGIQLIGSTTSGIAGAFVGTAGAGNIVTIDVRATSPSDIRLKENIQDVTLGLDFVNKLRPVSYNLIADESKQGGFGFIAQEVEKLGVAGTSLVYHDPQAKTGDVEGHMVIHYPSYVAILTRALQEMDAKFSGLQARFDALEAKMQDKP